MEFERVESIKGEIYKKMYEGEKKEQGNCDETKRASRDISDILLQRKPIKLGNRYYFITHCNAILITHL